MVRSRLYNGQLLVLFLFFTVGASDSIPAIPSNAEIIKKVFELSSLPLLEANYCKGCAPLNTKDPTIGDFLSTFWAAHSDTCGKNFVKVTIEPFTQDGAVVMLKEYVKKDAISKNTVCAEALWMVDFEICKRCDRENDRWCWGIRFLMKQSDRKVIPGTVWCLGAG